ncbi:hypothetical protein MGYG_08989 [Nannizzia gypsea CBS 118893]|uniref:Uncharacterized protein n=1 Tax=Arthroderma gypseum (strain ATCC MYA-4604 / CBS 118893) TaxID=535722 RepID=E4UN94_ARTGP|nr:hypothetical protein MGYG_08989 [Nannizzia gypsea CBS 118893]EFQ99555.1 hypothetical protein MGYG_08989 [Nannizzia gypsea CBS 118893]
MQRSGKAKGAFSEGSGKRPRVAKPGRVAIAIGRQDALEPVLTITSRRCPDGVSQHSFWHSGIPRNTSIEGEDYVDGLKASESTHGIILTERNE